MHAVAAVVGGVVVVRSGRGEKARLEVVGRRRGVVQSSHAVAAIRVRVRPTVGVLQRRRPLGRDVQRVVRVRGPRRPVRVQGVVGDDLQGDGRMVDARRGCRGRSGCSGGGVVAVVDGVVVRGGGGLNGTYWDRGMRGQVI